jgi:hypothetical protein
MSQQALGIAQSAGTPLRELVDYVCSYFHERYLLSLACTPN